MRQSMFFYKQLTSAEVGQSSTHEIYIRLSNNFDYETFFGNEKQQNENGTISINFNALNTLNGENVSLRFVFYSNSNKEKRIPSLSNLFKDNNVDVDDVVQLESRNINGIYSFYIRFFKKGTIKIDHKSFTLLILEEEKTEKIVSSIVNKSTFNKIFYGSPGTGKSYKVDEITKGQSKTIVTFHPDTDYASFVGAYKPTNDAGKISYEFVPQAFAKAYVNAWKNLDQPHYLCIEEINRGNCAQAFGDIFQLLDRNPNGFSKYSIDVDKDFADYLKTQLSDSSYQEEIKETLGLANDSDFDYSKIILPKNLYIFATMNTSDQSLFPMDSAFKRRWDWEYIPIDYEKAKEKNIEIDDKKYNWGDFLLSVNPKIEELTGSEDKKLGAFFVNAKTITKEQFCSKVMFYLWQEIYKEEHLSPDSIFKIKENGEIKHFTFGQLFTDESKFYLQKFMESLKVNPITDFSEENE